jgi:DNA-binding NarL/FixJ family response regulator
MSRAVGRRPAGPKAGWRRPAGPKAGWRRPAGPKAGWDALTETERRVATLPAEGLSNPDIAACMFTSRRIVQFQVSNMLAKLDPSSRVELAELVAHRAG